MFTVYHSNELEVLVELCIHLMQISRNKSGDPLLVHQFVVQRPEIFTYLKQTIALETGIAARIESQTIWKFVWEAGRAIMPNFPESSPFDRSPLTLNILSLFEQGDFSLKTPGSTEESLDQDLGFKDILDYITGHDYTPFDGDSLTEPLKNGTLDQALAPIYASEASKNDPSGLNATLETSVSLNSARTQGLNLPFIDNLKNDYASRRYALASRLASVYECYQIYRPDWILAWKNGDTSSWLGANPEANKVKNCRWIARLWHEYIIKNSAQGEEEWDRATAIASILTTLKNPSAQTLERIKTALPQDIYVFGASSLPPSAFDVLIALGHYINVHFMLCNPCREYWGDLASSLEVKKLRAIVSKRAVMKPNQTLGIDFSQTATDENSWLEKTMHYDKLTADCFNASFENLIAHPLLLSLGKQGRDMLSVLTEKMYSQGDDQVNEIFAFVPSVATDPKTPEPSLLKRLQADILNGRTEQDETGRYALNPTDTSVQIVGCAGKLREIQELYDAVLDAFMADPTLTPRDVVVMVPNLKSYVPYIRAVFAMNDTFVTKLRYRICDRSLKEENPCLKAVCRMLKLNDTPLTALELVDLLGNEQIMRQYGLTALDLPLIKKFVSNGNMVFGLESKDLMSTDEHLKLDENFAYTINAGLERELLGALMPKLENDEAVPYLTGIDSHGTEILGHLGCFVDDLNTFRAELEDISSQNLVGATGEDAWRKFVQRSIMFRFFKFADGEQEVLRTVSFAFSTLRDNMQHTKAQPPITLTLVRNLIEDAAAGQSEFSHFLDGSLNFCTFVPMRSIPFRHIFMVGLNDGDFPRNTESMSFDPIDQDFRKGDRSRRDDDRYMFMEGLTAAKESLYISYCARDQIKGTELNPSVVVNELVDYIIATTVRAGDEEEEPQKREQHVLAQVVKSATLNVFDDDNFKAGTANNRGQASCQVYWRGFDVHLNADESKVRTTTVNLPADRLEFKEKQCIGLNGFTSGRMLPSANGVLNIDVADLVSFYTKGPIPFFREKILGLYKEHEHPILKYENFTIENLVEFNFRVQMVTKNAQDFKESLLNAQLKGMLPAYQSGADYISYLEKIYASTNVSALREKFMGHNLTENVDIDLTLPLSENLGYWGELLHREVYPQSQNLKIHLTGLLTDVCFDEDEETLNCLNLWLGGERELRLVCSAALKFLLLAISNNHAISKVKIYHRGMIDDPLKVTLKKLEEKYLRELSFTVKEEAPQVLLKQLQLMVAAYLVGRVWPLPLLVRCKEYKAFRPKGKNGFMDSSPEAWSTFKKEFFNCLQVTKSDYNSPDLEAQEILGDGKQYEDLQANGSSMDTNDTKRCRDILRATFEMLQNLGLMWELSKAPKGKTKTTSKKSTRSRKNETAISA